MRLALVSAAMLLASAAANALAQKLVSPAEVTPPPPAISQPPSPSGAEREQLYQGEGRKAGQKRGTEPRGTEDQPIIAKILPAEKTAAEREQEERDRRAKVAADLWNLRLTTALIGVGTLQFLALVGQAIVFGIQARRLRDSIDLTRTIADRQERDTRDSITEAARAASAMRDAADAANAHARAAEEGNKINREALVTSNRPWIALEITIPEDSLLMFTDTHIELSVKLTAKNMGRSPATRINPIVWFYPDMTEAARTVTQIGIPDIPADKYLAGHGRMLFPEKEFSHEFFLRLPIDTFKNSIKTLNENLAKDQILLCIQDEGRPAVVAIAWYSIPGGGLARYTAIVGEIVNTLPERYGFTGTKGAFTNFEIVESFVSGRAT